MKRYYSIDFFRFVAAFLVVFIHVPTKEISDLIIPISRVAVPFFFMTSGFFVSNNSQKIIKEIKKVFKYTILFTLLYFLWNILGCILNKQSIYEYLKDTYTIKRTISFILFNNSFTSLHLWYLSALLYVLIIYYFANRYNLIKILKKLILPLIIINLLFGKYSMIIFNRTFHDDYVRNFLFFGLPFFMIGYMFKEVYEKITFGIKDYIAFFIVSVLSILEAYILKINSFTQGDIYILTPILSIIIFKYLILNPEKGAGIKLDNKIPLYIYIYHIIVIKILKIIVEYLNLGSIYKYFAFIVVYFTVLVLSYFYLKIKYLIFNRKQRDKYINECN